jgi:hypothetical protein
MAMKDAINERFYIVPEHPQVNNDINVLLYTSDHYLDIHGP